MIIQAMTSYYFSKWRTMQKVDAILKCKVLSPDCMRTLLNLRICLAQSGPKPSDTFKCAIYRFFWLQTTRRSAPSLLAKF